MRAFRGMYQGLWSQYRSTARKRFEDTVKRRIDAMEPIDYDGYRMVCAWDVSQIDTSVSVLIVARMKPPNKTIEIVYMAEVGQDLSFNESGYLPEPYRATVDEFKYIASTHGRQEAHLC